MIQLNSQTETADISALERHFDLERKSLEHRRKMLICYTKKLLDNMQDNCEVELRQMEGGPLTFHFTRIVQEKGEYFNLYMYSDMHNPDVMKKGMKILDKIIKEGQYPNGTMGPSFDFELSPHPLKPKP